MITFPVLLLILSSAHPQPVTPQDFKRLSIEELTQVDITTVSRRVEPLAQVPSAVSVVRGEDIRRSGVTSVAEAMRLAEGVEVARANATTYAISARGFNITTANKLLVMVDGRTVYSPLFAGTFWDVLDLPLADVDRIEVIRGPGGTIWGANAVNGVVNVITKSAADTHGLRSSLTVGSEDRTIATTQYGGQAGTADYRVYGRFRYTDAGRFSTGESAHDPVRMGRAGFRVDSDTSGSNRWLMQGEAYVGAEGLADRDDTDVSGGSVMARWTHRQLNRAEFRAQVYYDHVFRHVAGQLRHSLDTFDVDTQQHLLLGGRHDVVVGGAFRVSRGKDIGNPAFFFDPSVSVINIGSVFAQDEITLVPGRVALIAGTKFERNTYTGVETQPSVKLRVNPGTRHTIWGGVSRAVRLPTRFDTDLRFTNPVTGAITLTGSRDFESEKMLAWEGGYRSQLYDRVSLDVAAYVNTYDDLRSEEFPSRPVQPIRLDNRMNATTRGIELGSNVLLAPWWRMHASYMYLHERFTFDPGSTDPTAGANEAEDPSHQFSLRSSTDLPKDLELDAAFRRIGRLPHPVVPAYSELDVRLGWNVGRHWTVGIVGRNLLHDRHLEFASLGSSVREEFERAVHVVTLWRF
jgi:iron complex outermembrane receptor protein